MKAIRSWAEPSVTTCRWWQRHEYSKWEYYKETWVRSFEHLQITKRVRKEFRKRTCSRCGHEQVQFINEYYLV